MELGSSSGYVATWRQIAEVLDTDFMDLFTFWIPNAMSKMNSDEDPAMRRRKAITCFITDHA